MSLILRAALDLQPGCGLAYDPPVQGGDIESSRFFTAYRGRKAAFQGYGEDYIGPLDFKGRDPGRYLNRQVIKVRFENEEEVRTLNAPHFVVVDPAKAAVASTLEESVRLGDLPHLLHHYPGDLVSFVQNRPEQFSTNVPRTVGTVFLEKPFTKGGLPRYLVMETVEEFRARLQKLQDENEARPADKKLFISPMMQRGGVNVPGCDLKLEGRGNVYWLYHEPLEMSFGSDREEAEFWSSTGISCPVGGDYSLGVSLELFRKGEADVLVAQRVRHYYPHRLLSRWDKHRPRVRALTERLFKTELGEAA